MSGPQNPQAYPCLDASEGCGLSMRDPGMTLRDWFAGQALAGIASDSALLAELRTQDAVALSAYNLADAMLAARTQSKDTPQ